METDMPSLSKKAQIDMQRAMLQVDNLHVQYSKRKYISNYRFVNQQDGNQ